VEPTRTTAFIFFAFRLIPLALRRAVFRAALRLFYHASVKQRVIALHNLKCAFPEKSLDEIETIARGVYRHLALVMADLFEMPWITRETLHEWADAEGLEHVERALAQGKGVLSVVAHFGHWELMTVAVPLMIKPMQIVYRPLDSPVMDNLLGWSRTKHGNALIPKGARGSGSSACSGRTRSSGS